MEGHTEEAEAFSPMQSVINGGRNMLSVSGSTTFRIPRKAIKRAEPWHLPSPPPAPQLRMIPASRSGATRPPPVRHEDTPARKKPRMDPIIKRTRAVTNYSVMEICSDDDDEKPKAMVDTYSSSSLLGEKRKRTPIATPTAEAVTTTASPDVAMALPPADVDVDDDDIFDDDGDGDGDGDDYILDDDDDDDDNDVDDELFDDDEPFVDDEDFVDDDDDEDEDDDDDDDDSDDDDEEEEKEEGDESGDESIRSPRLSNRAPKASKAKANAGSETSRAKGHDDDDNSDEEEDEEEEEEGDKNTISSRPHARASKAKASASTHAHTAERVTTDSPDDAPSDPVTSAASLWSAASRLRTGLRTGGAAHTRPVTRRGAGGAADTRLGTWLRARGTADTQLRPGLGAGGVAHTRPVTGRGTGGAADTRLRTGQRARGTAHASRDPHAPPRIWKPEEDDKLKEAVQKLGIECWLTVAAMVPDRTNHQCRKRWVNTLDPANAKNKSDPKPRCSWKSEEDAKLKKAIQKHGDDWVAVAKLVPGRTNKQCGARWVRHLDPVCANGRKGKWTPEEVTKLAKAVKKHGNDWVAIATLFPGRTNDRCRERWTNNLGPANGYKYGKWSTQEDAKLKEAVQKHGNDWVKAAAMVSSRTKNQCLQRWEHALNPANGGRGKWTPEEDAILIEAVQKLGKKWSEVAKLVPGRTSPRCRARWVRSLDPTNVKKLGKWTPQEVAKLAKAVKKHGKDWVPVAAMVPGRSDLQCRERWVYIGDPAIKIPGKWKLTEDAKLVKAVKKYGKDWVAVAALLPGRTNKQCQRRGVKLTQRV